MKRMFFFTWKSVRNLFSLKANCKTGRLLIYGNTLTINRHVLADDQSNLRKMTHPH